MKFQCSMVLVCAIGLVLAMPFSAQAVEYTWDNGGGDNDWYNPTNWDPDGTWDPGADPPGAPDFSDDYVVNDGTPIASFDPSQNVNIGPGGGSVTINGGDVQWNGRFCAIGNTGAGTLTIKDGSFTRNRPGDLSNRFAIGNSFNSDGYFYQEGGAVTFNDKPLYVTWYASTAKGLYEISGGSLALNAGILLGNSGTSKFRYIGDSATVTSASYSGANSRTTTYFELDGLTRTIIDVTGDVSLSGSTIDLSAAAGASIADETVFTLFSGGTLTAADINFVYDNEADWTVTVTEGMGGSITAEYRGAAPERIPGDANNNGVVNDEDASILAAHWQTGPGANWEDGDFNNDGFVNDQDASILAAHWLETGESYGAVPEPTTIVMLLGGLLSLWIWRRR